MRVLVVNGYPPSSHHGSARYAEFVQHVRRVLKTIKRQEVTDVDIIEKSRQDLDEYLFEMHSEFAEPSHITNFDRLDFVFVAGDPSACPWSPVMRKLALLTKMCMMTGKCFYGSGIGAGLLAFLCSSAGEPLRVINNDGKGSFLEDIQSVPPPTENAHAVGHSESAGTQVLLDTRSGDFFTFDAGSHTWVPHGNTGLMHHTSDHAHDYGAKVNTARAGTKTHRSELSHSLYASKRGDTKCCGRLEATNHPVLASLKPTNPSREFLINCNSTWDLDEQINATGNNKYQVLVDSSRGPMLIEFGNCIGTHFVMRKEYPESCSFLDNFVGAKFEAFKIHEHIDRSYVSAISGSSRLKDRLQLAQTKTSALAARVSAREENIHKVHNTGARQELPTNAATMTSGKTSPKRCRPVSAGPFRSVTRPIEAIRTIKTSRSVYPSTTVDPQGIMASPEVLVTVRDQTKVPSPTHAASARSRPSSSRPFMATARTVDESPDLGNNQSEPPRTRPNRPHTARASIRIPEKELNELQPEVESPAVDEPASNPSSSSPPRPWTSLHESQHQRAPIKAHRRIRVMQKNELEKPYCAIDKFNAMRDEEQAQNKEMYYSVVNDGPFMSNAEQEQLEYQRGKLKWVAGPFRTAFGKASSQIKPEASIFTRAPFVQKNTPYHIIQRRELEAPSPPRRQHKAKSPTRRDSPQRPTRARSASSSRKTHR